MRPFSRISLAFVVLTVAAVPVQGAPPTMEDCMDRVQDLERGGPVDSCIIPNAKDVKDLTEDCPPDATKFDECNLGATPPPSKLDGLIAAICLKTGLC